MRIFDRVWILQLSLHLSELSEIDLRSRYGSMRADNSSELHRIIELENTVDVLKTECQLTFNPSLPSFP